MVADATKEIPDLEDRAVTGARLAILVGCTLGLMGLLRLSFVVRFLSRPALSGFISAVAVTIIVAALKDVFGILAVERSSNIFEKVFNVVKAVPGQLDVFAFMLWLVSMLLLRKLKDLKKSDSKFMQSLADGKELVVVLLGIIFAFVQSLATDQIVPHVGVVPQGLPRPSLTIVSMEMSELRRLLPTAATTAFVIFITSFAAAKKFALRSKYRVDPAKELLALGVANVFGGVFGAFPSQGSLSRTAIAYECGLQSQFGTGVFAAITVGLGLEVLTSVIFYLPMATLAAVIINTATGLLDYMLPLELYSLADEVVPDLGRDDLVVWVVSAVVTLWHGASAGIVGAVVISVLLLVYQVAEPPIEELCKVGSRWHVHRFWKETSAIIYPSVLVVRIDGPLFFANAELFADRVAELVRSRSTSHPVRAVVLAATALPFLDVTAVQVLQSMVQQFKNNEMYFLIAGAMRQTRHILEKYNFLDDLNQDDYYISIEEAVQLARAWSFKKYHEYDEAIRERSGLAEPLLKKEVLTNAIEDVKWQLRAEDHVLKIQRKWKLKLKTDLASVREKLAAKKQRRPLADTTPASASAPADLGKKLVDSAGQRSSVPDDPEKGAARRRVLARPPAATDAYSTSRRNPRQTIW
jgi:MFS superfamily sulfate permease-like transporter